MLDCVEIDELLACTLTLVCFVIEIVVGDPEADTARDPCMALIDAVACEEYESPATEPIKIIAAAVSVLSILLNFLTDR